MGLVHADTTTVVQLRKFPDPWKTVFPHDQAPTVSYNPSAPSSKRAPQPQVGDLSRNTFSVISYSLHSGLVRHACYMNVEASLVRVERCISMLSAPFCYVL